jgi:hypothetical protein
MVALLLFVLGITFFAEIIVGVALYVRSGRRAEKKSIARYLDQGDVGAAAGQEKPEPDRPSPRLGPTAWKQ